ncbi:hypothetical protein [Fusibacter ferrireducens]|uniref:Uncharacterized protein n=1 Tax=Fusibacter ferrireducens TaxID=2785058 RepID=A0ABR9ZYI9_9FIRM|nr:hypothetical protein [Fusibacter ferrireducens]MBF4695223.1 hypothetical protein [Fusibacter ferrireducens]
MNKLKPLNPYEQNVKIDDFMSVSETLIKEANEAGKSIEEDPSKLKHMIKNDLRDNMPPQIYALIGLISSTVEKLEKEQGQIKA